MGYLNDNIMSYVRIIPITIKKVSLYKQVMVTVLKEH